MASPFLGGTLACPAPDALVASYPRQHPGTTRLPAWAGEAKLVYRQHDSCPEAWPAGPVTSCLGPFF